MQLYKEDSEVIWAQLRLEPALIQQRQGVLPVLLLCIQDVSEVMDGTHSQIIAGSDAAQSAHSLYDVSQGQEEAIAFGLASIQLISSAKRHLQHAPATCAPAHQLSASVCVMRQSTDGVVPVAAMHHLRISSSAQSASTHR